MAVTDGRISALGDAARATTSTSTEVLDLGDAVVRPGFGDGHVHPLWGGIELAWAPIRDCTSVEEVVEAVRLHAAANPDDAWVLGGSYDPALAAGGLFDARWLDAAVPDRPVMLESSDHHCAWVNTAALRLCGITAETPDPPASRIARRPDGSPLGTLVEWEAVDLVKTHVPQPDEAARRAGLRASTRLLAAAGVTWAQEAAASAADLATYLAAAADGRPRCSRQRRASRRARAGGTASSQEFAAARASTRVSTWSRTHDQVLRRRNHRGGQRRTSRALRGRPGHLRSPGLGSGRARGGGRCLRCVRLPGAHPRHRRRRRTRCS